MVKLKLRKHIILRSKNLVCRLLQKVLIIYLWTLRGVMEAHLKAPKKVQPIKCSPEALSQPLTKIWNPSSKMQWPSQKQPPRPLYTEWQPISLIKSHHWRNLSLKIRRRLLAIRPVNNRVAEILTCKTLFIIV